MAVQHHLDQPLMQINEIDISPGFETQVKKHYTTLIDTGYELYNFRLLYHQLCTQQLKQLRLGFLQKREDVTQIEKSC